MYFGPRSLGFNELKTKTNLTWRLKSKTNATIKSWQFHGLSGDKKFLLVKEDISLLLESAFCLQPNISIFKNNMLHQLKTVEK